MLKSKIYGVSFLAAGLLIVAATLFTGSVPAYAAGCFGCAGGHCKGEINGGCNCTGSGAECTICGTCRLFFCVSPCVPLKKANVKPEQLESAIKPTEEFLQKHPWVTSAALLENVKKHSPNLARVLEQEQGALQKAWCTNFRKGSYADFRWEMFALDGGGVHYRIVETGETLDTLGRRFVIGKGEETITNGEF